MEAGAKLEGRVHLEAIDGSSARWRYSDNRIIQSIESEMLLPRLQSRMEKRNILAGNEIESGKATGFVEIAGFAGERQVLERIVATRRPRHDMLDLKSEIEDLLGCVTIFAAVSHPFRNCRIMPIHGFRC